MNSNYIEQSRAFYLLQNDENIFIGRHSNCDIILESLSISRKQFEVERIDGKYFVSNLSDNDQCIFDGITMDKNMRFEIEGEIIIELGEYKLQVRKFHDGDYVLEIVLLEEIEEMVVTKKALKVDEKEITIANKPIVDVPISANQGKALKMNSKYSYTHSDEEELCFFCMAVKRHNRCIECGEELDYGDLVDFYIKPGSKLNNGRYLIGKDINFGGFGITYIAYDYELKMKVAIKEFYPSNSESKAERDPDSNDVLISDELKENFEEGKIRFIEETKFLGKFNHLNSIVKVIDWFEDNHTIYMVMEYLDGIGLDEFIKHHDNRKLEYDEAIELIVPIIEALEEVHGLGVLHRDISPDNLYLVNEKLVLLDFGAAKYTNVKESENEIVKMGYSPIEYYSKKEAHGTWSDVYSLSACLYFMITGVKPLDSMDRFQKDILKSLNKVCPGVPKEISNTVMRGMATKKKNRLKNMSELLLGLTKKKFYKLPEEVIKARKVRNVSIVLANSLVVIAVILYYFNFVLERPLMDGKLADSTVTPLVDLDSESALNEVITNFEQQYTNVKFDFVSASLTDYNQEYTSRAGTINSIDMFKQNLLEVRESDDKLFSMIELYETLDEGSSYATDWLNQGLLKETEYPIGFDFKVIYYNENLLESYNTLGSDLSISDMLSFKSKTNMHIKLVSVSPNNVDALMYLFDIDLTTNVKSNDDYLGLKTHIDQGDIEVTTNALDDFLSEKSLFYIGNASDIQNILRGMPGYAGVARINNSKGKHIILGNITEFWSINDEATDSEKEIYMTFLGYLSGDYCQNVLSIQENKFLPVNKDILEMYMGINDDLSFIDINELKILREEARFIDLSKEDVDSALSSYYDSYTFDSSNE